MRDGERGSAVAESVMVMALLSVVFAAILQFGLVIHVRNTLIDAASAGARHGALGDRTPDDGAARTRELLAGSIPGGADAEVSAAVVGGPGVPLVRVTVRTSMPMVGFLTGPVTLEADGHAFRY
ncbi:pilus assembly protein [Citricoccus sp. SGAir0253]|uniref:TadE family protein n=1 Tax=Citricoccus sp. SGAir0253 TaxID=2567881 RepID=UPI0010CCBFA3|nr:TadE family protein [Citricoccus sp. SGAir0253]QCU78475.1 pilus assembly protein [Citricoccus sp. SGAir0253]